MLFLRVKKLRNLPEFEGRVGALVLLENLIQRQGLGLPYSLVARLQP